MITDEEKSEEDIDQVVEDFSLDKDVIAAIGVKTGEKVSDFLERYYHSDADFQGTEGRNGGTGTCFR